MSKYRFKTEEEFKRDGLWIKDHPNSWECHGKMNKYLGQDIPDSYNTICDKYEKFIYETWSFLPSDYVLKETAFVLPSKWCVKVDRDCQPEEVYKWRKMSWVDAGYINNSTTWTSVVLDNHTEITLEQFKQHVLKESPVAESSKEIDMKDIQEEAKKRFPIGCKFIPVNGTGTYTLKEDSYTYTIHSKQIYAHDCHGTLYNNGEWATLVSSPETKKEMFYEGDYIVTLDVEDGYNCAKRNYCFKQRVDNKGIYPAVDLQGSKANGHTVMSFDKKEYLKDWRYATPEEAAEYERLGQPYDVTTLQKKEESIPEYVECVRSNSGGFTVGKIYNWPNPTDDKGVKRPINNIHGAIWGFKPSTKEAYEAQNAPKKLTQEDLVEGEIYVYDDSHISTYPVGPSIAIKEKFYEPNERWMWTLSITHATEEQKALLRSYMKKDEKQEWSDTSELTPLEICKQKYRKGMRVMSADNSGMYSGEFIIEVDPDKFTKTGGGIDYQHSKGWLCMGDKYAEILEDNACEISSHEPFIKEVVKTQPNEELIKPIYSVNIDLVVKNKKNKIIF